MTCILVDVILGIKACISSWWNYISSEVVMVVALHSYQYTCIHNQLVSKMHKQKPTLCCYYVDQICRKIARSLRVDYNLCVNNFQYFSFALNVTVYRDELWGQIQSNKDYYFCRHDLTSTITLHSLYKLVLPGLLTIASVSFCEKIAYQ